MALALVIHIDKADISYTAKLPGWAWKETVTALRDLYKGTPVTATELGAALQLKRTIVRDRLFEARKNGFVELVRTGSRSFGYRPVSLKPLPAAADPPRPVRPHGPHGGTPNGIGPRTAAVKAANNRGHRGMGDRPRQGRAAARSRGRAAAAKAS